MLKTEQAMEIVGEYSKLASEYKHSISVSGISDEDLLFRLVVIGEIKSGKSSFINTLVGEESPQLPVGVPVTTSTAFVVSDGQSRKNQVYFNDDPLNERPPIIVDDDEVKEYGTENLNKNNKKEVREIEIRLPNGFLKRNRSMVIDTPGLGGIYKNHRQITWRYGPIADALCYVFESKQLIQRDIENAKQFWEMPERVGMSKRPIFFVQTKTDRCRPKEKLFEIAEENRNIISEHLDIPKSDLNYFLVDSNYKMRAKNDPDRVERLEAKSGYPELKDFFKQFQQRVLKQKDELLSRQLLADVRQAIEGNLQPYIQELIEISKASAEELSELENQLSKISKDMKEWEHHTFPKIKQDFLRRIEECLNEARDDLNSELAHVYRGSRVSPISNLIIEEHLNLVESVSDLKKHEQLSKMQENCVQVCEDRFRSIIAKTQQEAVNIIDEACEGMEKSIENVLESSYGAERKQRFSDTNIKMAHLSPRPNAIKIISEVSREASPLLITLGVITGLFKGVAAVAAVLTPPVTAALFMAPLVFGAYTRHRRSDEETKQEVRSNLDDIVRQIYDRAVSRFDSFADDIREATKNNLDDYLQWKLRELTDLWNKVDEQKKSCEADMDNTLSEIGVKNREKVEEDSKVVEKLLGRINRILDT